MDKESQKKPEPTPGRSGYRKAADLVYQMTVDILGRVNGGSGAHVQDIITILKDHPSLNLDEAELERNVQAGVELGLFKQVICKTVNGLYKLVDSVKPKQPLLSFPRPTKSRCPNPKGVRKSAKLTAANHCAKVSQEVSSPDGNPENSDEV